MAGVVELKMKIYFRCFHNTVYATSLGWPSKCWQYDNLTLDHSFGLQLWSWDTQTVEWLLLQACPYPVGALVWYSIWCDQRKSLCTLDLIAATLQAQWAVTLCCTHLLPPSGQMEGQIAGKSGKTSHVLWGVVDSEARWKNQLDLPWTAQASAESDLTEPISRLHLQSSPTLISDIHFLSFLLSSAYQCVI